MTNYNTLLSKNCDKYWEDLTTKEREMLVTSHIELKSTVIPNELQFQKAQLNILNLNLDNISHQDLLEEVLNMRNLLFQAIKEDVERDLEREEINQIESDEEDEEDKRLENLKDKLENLNSELLELNYKLGFLEGRLNRSDNPEY